MQSVQWHHILDTGLFSATPCMVYVNSEQTTQKYWKRTQQRDLWTTSGMKPATKRPHYNSACTWPLTGSRHSSSGKNVDIASGVAGKLFLLDLLQRVPLCNGSARIGKHVAPMSQLGARRSAAKRHTANWIWRTDTIVVNHSNHQRHFLQTFMSEWVSEQFLNGTSAQYRLCSAILWKLYNS